VAVDFAFVVLYVSVLALVGFAATRAGALWLGLLGIALAATAGVLDVTENVRLLRTLAADYGAMDETWLHTTAQVARAKFLAVLAAAGVLLPTLGLHARTALLNLRMATWGVTAVGGAGVVLGSFGLVLVEPGWLAGGLGLLVLVKLAITVLFIAGHIPVVDRGAPTGGAGAERV
jgi:hypothetical protein